MFRWVILSFCLLFTAIALAAAEDPNETSPILSAPLRSVPANLPKHDTSSNSFQVQGVDTELSIGIPNNDAPPSVFNQLSPQTSNLQRAQVLLKRNLLDDVTLSTQNNIGLADVAPSKTTGDVTAQSMQNQATSEIKWNVNDAWSVSGSNQMDQIFEFQRAEPNRIRNGLETHYTIRDGTTVGFGAANETYYDDMVMTMERHTSTAQFQQKLGSLPIKWTASPSLITETNPLDATQTRAGSRLDQSLLWNVNQDLTWDVGTGLGSWNYAVADHKEIDHNIYSQWTRRVHRNLSLTFRTDYETVSDTQMDTPNSRENRIRVSIGQQLKLTDDLSAAFDLRQQYERDLNSSWSPSDHSATFSLQKKF